MYDNVDLIRLMMILPTTYPLRDGLCIVVVIWKHLPLSICAKYQAEIGMLSFLQSLTRSKQQML
jgi:hypothetical protein